MIDAQKMIAQRGSRYAVTADAGRGEITVNYAPDADTAEHIRDTWKQCGYRDIHIHTPDITETG